jgi:hypothetical protein
MDFDTIFSQSALAAHLKYPLTASIIGRGAPAKSKLKKKRKAATLQISESQPMEIAQLKAPILSSDKSSSGVNVGGKSEVFQEEIFEPTMGPGTPAFLKRQKRTLEAWQEELPKSPELDIVQPSFAEQFLVMVAVPLTSPKDRAQPTELVSIEVCESLEHPTIPPSFVRPVDHPPRTREEKGKGKVGDDMPLIPMTERFIGSPLPGLIVDRTEDEAMRSFPEERTQGEQLEMTAKTHSDEMPETLRVEFLTSMFKTKIFAQKSRPTSLSSPDVKSLERTIAVEEQEPLATMPPSGVPSFHVPTDVGPLSDSDKETEQYLKRILSSVVAESPFAQISPIAEVTRKSLGLKHGGTKEAETTITKEVSESTVGKGEIQTISTADYESRLRQEGSIAS